MTLNDFLQSAPPGTAARLAREAGVSDATISRLRHGKVAPSIRVAKAIYDETDGQVGVHDWPTRKPRP